MGMVGFFPDNFQNVLFDKGMMNLACQVADTGLVVVTVLCRALPCNAVRDQRASSR